MAKPAQAASMMARRRDNADKSKFSNGAAPFYANVDSTPRRPDSEFPRHSMRLAAILPAPLKVFSGLRPLLVPPFKIEPFGLAQAP
jgi:hypothetical protein